MNQDEVEQILVAAMQVDDRISVDKFRVAAWAEILDKDMPYAFGIQTIKDHYGSETTVVMPAHLNRAWRSLRRERKEIEKTKQLTSHNRANISPETQLQLDELRKRLAIVALKTHPDKAQAKEHRPE